MYGHSHVRIAFDSPVAESEGLAFRNGLQSHLERHPVDEELRYELIMQDLLILEHQASYAELAEALYEARLNQTWACTKSGPAWYYNNMVILIASRLLMPPPSSLPW